MTAAEWDFDTGGAPENSNGAPSAPPPDPWTPLVTPVPQAWYTTTPPKREWLLRDRRTSDGALARGVVGLLAASGGAGKSMLLSQLAVAIATGTPWLGEYEPTSMGRVLLVLAEETTDEIHRRLWRAAGAMHVAAPDDGAIDSMGLHGVDCALLASGERGADPLETGFAQWLRKRVANERYAAVLLDPHSRLGGRDAETSNAAATRAVQIYESIASSGAAVLVAHHTPQWERRGGEGGQAAARGVTGLVDGVRWMLHASVERVDGVDAHLRELVTVASVKSNYARRGDPVVLRRSQDWGGALVPLDDADHDTVSDARRDSSPAAQRAAARDETQRRRDADDDACVRAILVEQPDVTVRDLRAEVRGRRGCGGDLQSGRRHRPSEEAAMQRVLTCPGHAIRTHGTLCV